MSASIQLSHIRKFYRRPETDEPDVVLRDFSLTVENGELVALVGASGVGKTTVLHLAAGLDKPDQGSVTIGAGNRPSRIGMVFQQPRLLEWLSVQKNIDIVVEAAGLDPARGRELLGAVGLERYRDAFPLSLSGGQRQRVALARAFAVSPDLMLLDEPFSALDELTARRLRLLLQALWLENPPTGILVTHNMMEAAFLADRVIILGEKPARTQHVIEIDLPRPRSPEDPAIFEIHRDILRKLDHDNVVGRPGGRLLQ